MEVLAWVIGVPVGIALLLCAPWLAEMMTRGGGGTSSASGVANALQEAFDPGAARSRVVIEKEQEKKTESESGDDEDTDDRGDDLR